MISSEFVDLDGGVNQRLRAACKDWEILDRYRNPGPTQLFGEGKDMVNKTIFYNNGNYGNMAKDVKDLCELIQRECTFIENPQLMVAAIASLRSTIDVVNSFDDEYNYMGRHLFQKLDKILH